MAMKYFGLVKSFNPQKGWGFIECPQTYELYGKDMFVLKNALPGGLANKGDQVAFTVVQEHNGPVAATVEVVHRGSVTVAPPVAGLDFGMLNIPSDVPQDAMNNSIQPHASNNTAEDLSCAPGYVGTIKSFNSGTGWGMIACPEMMTLHGKDVFFSQGVVREGCAAQGEHVFFVVRMEPKGPAAASVRVLSLQRPMPAVMPALPGPTMGLARFGCGKGGAAMLPQAGLAMMGTPRAPGFPQKDQTFFGILKSFSEEKGWGHITCECTNRLYGKDVFLMKGALNGQTVNAGALLSFKVTLGSKGPQAMAVNLLPPGCFRGSAEETASIYTGTVKSFNAERGWGFVTSEELQQTFGKDIFLHRRDLEDNYQPTTGEEIQFCVEIDDGGQPVAKNAVPLGGRVGGPPQMNAASWAAVATNNAQTMRAAPY